MAYKFSPKDPAETVLITFDFTDVLDAGNKEIILSAIWTVETIVGIDAQPQLIFGNWTPSINISSTSRLITGGINGCTYNIHVVATTSQNQVFKMTSSLEIKTQ